MTTANAGIEERGWSIALLVETGAVLSSSLDLATTMSHVAQLTIPTLADLCVIDLRDGEGAISELAAASADPELARSLEGLRSRCPLDPAGAHPVANVIRSGEAQLLPEMSRESLRSFAQGSEHARFMIANGYRSAIVAPLTARGRTLGALSTLRTYPGWVAARVASCAFLNAMRPLESWSSARWFSSFLDQRMRIPRLRFSQEWQASTTQRRAFHSGLWAFSSISSPRARMCGVSS